MLYREWNSIEVSYNSRTLTAVVEACDNINKNKNVRISVALSRRYSARNSLYLMSSGYSFSFKDLSFYDVFHDAAELDECVDLCYTGKWSCPKTVPVFCSLDGGVK